MGQEIVNLGWLKDYSGTRFAPKTTVGSILAEGLGQNKFVITGATEDASLTVYPHLSFGGLNSHDAYFITPIGNVDLGQEDNKFCHVYADNLKVLYSIDPIQNQVGSIGNREKWWQNGYILNLYTNEITASNNIITPLLDPFNDTSNIGHDLDNGHGYWNNAYINNLKGNLLLPKNPSSNIGSGEKPWNNVYANNFFGDNFNGGNFSGDNLSVNEAFINNGNLELMNGNIRIYNESKTAFIELNKFGEPQKEQLRLFVSKYDLNSQSNSNLDQSSLISINSVEHLDTCMHFHYYHNYNNTGIDGNNKQYVILQSGLKNTLRNNEKSDIHEPLELIWNYRENVDGIKWGFKAKKTDTINNLPIYTSLFESDYLQAKNLQIVEDDNTFWTLETANWPYDSNSGNDDRPKILQLRKGNSNMFWKFEESTETENTPVFTTERFKAQKFSGEKYSSMTPDYIRSSRLLLVGSNKEYGPKQTLKSGDYIFEDISDNTLILSRVWYNSNIEPEAQPNKLKWKFYESSDNHGYAVFETNRIKLVDASSTQKDTTITENSISTTHVNIETDSNPSAGQSNGSVKLYFYNNKLYATANNKTVEIADLS